MAYLDSHGLETLWTKIKTSFGAALSATAASTTVDITLKDKASTPNLLSTATIPAATTSAAGAMTAADKTKLNGLENYTLPIASASTLGGIKVGSNLSIDSAGVLSATAEAQVQADWSETDTTDPSFIKNKPTALSAFSQDTTHRLVSDTEKSTWNGKYAKPSDGIPKTDLASAVQTSLGKADSAVQPSSLATVATSGSYTDLSDKPTIAGGSSTSPKMDGTAAVGTEAAYAHGDHVHPTDTSRQAKITASGILKGDGSGGVSAATAGTDYQTPISFQTAYSSSNKAATMSDVAAAVTGVATYKGGIGSESDVTTKLLNNRVGWYWNVTADFDSSTFGIRLEKGNQIFCHAATELSVVAANFDVIQKDIDAIPDSVIEALS